MPEPYTPSPPTGVGTDDYRCFLLDPQLAEDSYLTGTNVVPGNADIAHHVILFRVPPEQVADAERLDAETRRPRLDLLRRVRPARRLHQRRRRQLARAPGRRAARRR